MPTKPKFKTISVRRKRGNPCVFEGVELNSCRCESDIEDDLSFTKYTLYVTKHGWYVVGMVSYLGHGDNIWSYDKGDFQNIESAVSYFRHWLRPEIFAVVQDMLNCVEEPPLALLAG